MQSLVIELNCIAGLHFFSEPECNVVIMSGSRVSLVGHKFQSAKSAILITAIRRTHPTQ